MTRVQAVEILYAAQPTVNNHDTCAYFANLAQEAEEQASMHRTLRHAQEEEVWLARSTWARKVERALMVVPRPIPWDWEGWQGLKAWASLLGDEGLPVSEARR